MRIQADMYAVELGAALLLQFETPTGVVRILADAGRETYRVNDRLADSVRDFGGGKLRIDLMIGTHYDADHLDGLVDIINNEVVEIGEAWLPPIANDTEFVVAGSPVRDSSLLALQLALEDGPAVLRNYLNAKADLCDHLATVERRADRPRGIEPRAVNRSVELRMRWQNAYRHADTRELARLHFEAELKDAEVTIGQSRPGHADEETADPWRVKELLDGFVAEDPWWPRHRPFSDDLSDVEVVGTAEAQTLALVRQSAARDAINASSLAAVVEALKHRGVNIRSAIIPDGEPRKFGWVRGQGEGGRFEPARPADTDAPEIVLLGPSEALVDKFRVQLPIGTYLFAARMATIPVASITASNQLSYSMVVEHLGQRILVSGDAGANDFRPGTSAPYYPKLIAELAPLNVVQVAHHGGANAHFYRVLLDAAYPGQPETTYLLLSHKTHDTKRPSGVFSLFIAALRRTPSNTQLLFTSKPLETMVRDVVSYIAPVEGPPGKTGNLRLVYDTDGWTVEAHAVAVR